MFRFSFEITGLQKLSLLGKVVNFLLKSQQAPKNDLTVTYLLDHDQSNCCACNAKLHGEKRCSKCGAQHYYRKAK